MSGLPKLPQERDGHRKRKSEKKILHGMILERVQTLELCLVT